MTIGICIHVLLVALAGLLLLERRLNENRSGVDNDVTGPIDFHPEQIVRWDDEADYVRAAACSRPSIARRPARRQLPSTPERRSHTP